MGEDWPRWSNLSAMNNIRRKLKFKKDVFCIAVIREEIGYDHGRGNVRQRNEKVFYDAFPQCIP
jgi:hypothetical protein